MPFKIKPVGKQARIAGTHLSSLLKNNPLQVIAKENLDIIKSGMYSPNEDVYVNISDLIDHSVNGTKYFPYDSAPDIKSTVMVIEVTPETTNQAAVRLLKEGNKNIVALNFASATNPGGGWLHGALAQEEDLCRRSVLYECLRGSTEYYNKNIPNGKKGYSDGMIYSPSVSFIRDEDYKLLEVPYSLSIITAPAPNVWQMEDPSEDNLREIFKRRTGKILRIAAEYKHKTIILGAWGCGAFGNNAQMVAEAFDDALREVPVFEHVCFAVYDTHKGQPTFNTFNDHFLGFDEG